MLRRKGREAGLPPSPVDGGDGVGGGDKGERRSAEAEEERDAGCDAPQQLYFQFGGLDTRSAIDL